MSRIYFVSVLVFGCWVLGAFSATAQGAFEDDKTLKRQEKFIQAISEKTRGNSPKAFELLQEILKEEPNNATVCYEMARMLEIKGEDTEATAFAERACKNDPSNPWFQELAASLYQKTGRNGDAVALAKTLVDKYPTRWDYTHSYAGYLLKGGRSKEALQVYTLWEKTNGPSQKAILARKDILQSTGNMEGVVAELQNLITLNPYTETYSRELIDYYRAANNTKALKALYEQLLTSDPYNQILKLELTQLEKGKSAVPQQANQAVSLFEDPATPLDVKKEYWQKQLATPEGRTGQGLSDLVAALQKTHPGHAFSLLAEGQLAQQNGKFNEATRLYRESLKKDDALTETWEALGLLLQSQGKYSELKKHAEAMVDYYPNNPIGYTLLAEAQTLLGQGSKSIALLDEATRIAGGNATFLEQVQSSQIRLLGILNKPDDVQNVFGKMTTPKALWKALAWAATGNSNADKALAQAQKETNDSFFEKLVIAEVQLKLGKYNDAKNTCQSLLAQGGAESARALELLGDAQAGLGAKAEALESWRKAAQISPNVPALTKKLAQ